MKQDEKTTEVTVKMGAMKTAMLHNLNGSNNALPMIASVLHVEQDGQIWLEVKTKIHKWERTEHLPISLQFLSDDCQIYISGIGEFVKDVKIPGTLDKIPTSEKEKRKPVMQVKAQFGEYIPLPSSTSRNAGITAAAFNAYKQLHDMFLGRSNRRLFVFH